MPDKIIISNNLNSKVKEIINGIILGDGTIIINGNDAGSNTELKEKSFVDFLYNVFKPFNIVRRKVNTSIIKPSGNIRIAYYFSTVTLPFFTDLH